MGKPKMVACRVCGNQVSDHAPSCPSCGDAVALRFGNAPRASKGNGIAALIIGGAIVLGMALSQSKPEKAPAPATDPTDADTILTIAACSAAQEAVKPRLKSPATAKFPSCAFGAREYVIHANPERSAYQVSGHVDSQNDLGATVRTKFSVILIRSGDGLGPSSFSIDRVALSR